MFLLYLFSPRTGLAFPSSTAESPSGSPTQDSGISLRSPFLIPVMAIRALAKGLAPAPVQLAFEGLRVRPSTPDPGTCRQVPPSLERWAPLPTGVYGPDILALHAYLRHDRFVPLPKSVYHVSDGIAARRTEGDIPEEALFGSERARFPVRKDGESADPNGSGFGTLGQIRVFWRDAPESFEGDPDVNVRAPFGRGPVNGD
jgi:hypothetical protein